MGRGGGVPHTWIATGGSAARAGLEGIQPHMGRVPASIVDACVRVPVCVFPPPPLPPSALRHAPRPRLPGQPEPEVPDGGWGGGVPRKGDPVLPAHADWGRRAPTWDTDGGGSHRTALLPPLPRAATPPHPSSPHPSPLGFSGPPVATHRQRELSGKRGGFGAPPGGLAIGRALAKLPGEED